MAKSKKQLYTVIVLGRVQVESNFDIEAKDETEAKYLAESLFEDNLECSNSKEGDGSIWSVDDMEILLVEETILA